MLLRNKGCKITQNNRDKQMADLPKYHGFTEICRINGLLALIGISFTRIDIFAHALITTFATGKSFWLLNDCCQCPGVPERKHCGASGEMG